MSIFSKPSTKSKVVIKDLELEKGWPGGMWEGYGEVAGVYVVGVKGFQLPFSDS